MKTPESLLNQEVELNDQVKGQDHSQVLFQEMNNLPNYQCHFQKLEFGQVQMGVLK